MERNLPNQKLVLAGIKGAFFFLLVTLFTLSANAQRVVGHARGNMSTANLTMSYQTATGQLAPLPTGINAVDPYAVYSNIQVANFSGYAYPNVGDGSGFTTLVADDIQFDGSSSVYNIDKVRFTMFNLNAASCSVRPCLRFYTLDGTTGAPSQLIAAYNFNPITIAAGNGSIITGTLGTPFLVYDQIIWAGIFFDNGGTSTATLTQLDNFGPGMFDPADVGSSLDLFWQSDLSYDFLDNDPAGGFYDFGGAPVASFGWELVQDNPIPVAIEYLHGNKNGSRHDLSWKISTTATPRVTIALQRGDNNRNFTDLYSVTADAPRCASPFNYTDASPIAGMNFYRLKITDQDGKVTYSTIIALLNKQTGFEIVGIMPNPAINSTVLNVSSAQKDQLAITVYDMSGKLVMSQSHTLIAGSNQISLDVSKLAKGTYHVSGCSSDGNTKTVSLLKL